MINLLQDLIKLAIPRDPINCAVEFQISFRKRFRNLLRIISRLPKTTQDYLRLSKLAFLLMNKSSLFRKIYCLFIIVFIIFIFPEKHLFGT